MITKTKFNQAPLNKVKIENRDFLVSKLETGDLVKTKAESYPLIFHYGIVEKNLEGLFIIHNHPDKINSKGGNTVREPLEKWIKGREIVSVEKTDLKTDDIEKQISLAQTQANRITDEHKAINRALVAKELKQDHIFDAFFRRAYELGSVGKIEFREYQLSKLGL